MSAALNCRADISHEHHRELQALGAVDGHDGDAAGPRPAGGSLLPGGARQRGRIDGTDEGRDAARARPGAEGTKRRAYFPAALAVLHGTEGGEVAGRKQKFLPAVPPPARSGPPGAGLSETLVEACTRRVKSRPRPALDGLQDCAVEADAGVLIGVVCPGPETDEVVVRKAEHRPSMAAVDRCPARGCR